MSLKNLSWKALLFGVVTIGVSWLVLGILIGLIEMAILQLILGPPPINAVDEFMREYINISRFATLTSLFVSIILTFALGGYVAARTASSHVLLHSLTVVFLGIAAFAVVASNPNYFMFARNSTIAVLAGLVGWRIAIRRKMVENEEPTRL